MDHMLFCEKCDEVIVKSTASSTKIRSKVVIIRDGKTYAVCKGCNSDLELPVTMTLNPNIHKAVSRLYVKE